MTDPARIFVTGATGFLGRAVMRALGGQGHTLIGTYRRAIPDDAPEGVIWEQADLTDPSDIARLCATHKPSHLLGLAWYMGPGAQGSVENFTWLARSVDLLSAFAEAGGARVAFCGSCMEYDWRLEEPFIEDISSIEAQTEYGLAKSSLYRVFGSYCAKLGLSGAWGRPYFLYGPGEAPHRLAADVIISLLEGREALCTHGLQKRDFLHVDDVADAMIRLLWSNYEGPLNIGSGRAIALKDLIEEAGRQIGRPELIRLGARETRPGDPVLVEADITRLSQTLGWRPRYDLQSGIADTIAWWRQELEKQA